jgi:hypothetical protein
MESTTMAAEHKKYKFDEKVFVPSQKNQQG